MRSYRNISILVLVFYTLFSCNMPHEQQILTAEKLSQNFGYTNSSSDSSQKSQDDEKDTTYPFKELLKKAILETLISGELSAYIEPDDFKKGFVKSWRLFSKENRHEFEGKKNEFHFSDSEFKDICIKVIKFGENKGFFSE